MPSLAVVPLTSLRDGGEQLVGEGKRLLKLGSVTATLHVLLTGNGQLSSGNSSVHK